MQKHISRGNCCRWHIIVGLTFAQRLLKSTVDRYLSPKEGKTTTISLPLFSGLWATLHSHTASGNSSGQHLNFARLIPPKVFCCRDAHCDHTTKRSAF